MAKLLENLKSLGTKKLIAIGVIAVLTMAIISSIAFFASRPNMTTLYSGLDPSEAGQAVSALESMGIPVEASNNGTSILVPKEMISKARMGLAEKGLPAASGVGYELFDKADGFGLTTFMQRVNRLRAMEGELSRTISTLNNVKSSRVHLVLPERESFSRNAPDPTASVIVTMKNGHSLDISQAKSIRHLVAAAVPSLKPDNVTITDNLGNNILSENDNIKTSGENKLNIETKLQKNIEDILIARLGNGNIRVGVTAEIETTREVRRRHEYDPDGRVVRSTQTVEEKQRQTDASSDNPTTVQQNLPNADLLGGNNAGASSSNDREEEVINYEITNEIIERTIEPGDIRKLSVAVLVNGSYTTDANGEKIYEPRSPEEIASIENLVKTAMGFNASRGDMISIESLQFTDVPTLETDTTLTFNEILAKNIDTLITWVVLLIITIVLILVVIRPLLRYLTEPNQEEDIKDPELDIIAAAGESPTTIVSLSQEATATDTTASVLQELYDLADENPESMLDIIRNFAEEK